MQTHKPPSFIFALELFILTFYADMFDFLYLTSFMIILSAFSQMFWKTRLWVHSLKCTPSFTIVID